MTAQAMQGDREKCLAAGMDDYLAKPIRPKDVRAIIERWSSESGSSASAQPVLPPVAAPPDPEEPPVEMDRLLDLGGGNAESLRELVELYFKQTTGQLAQLETAVQREPGRGSAPGGAQLRRRQRHPGHDAAGAVVAGIGAAGQGRPVDQRATTVRRGPARIQTHPGFPGEASGPGRDGCDHGSFMKKVLIIEDDQIIANIYRNKFAIEGYQAEVAFDGESGLKIMRTFQPDVMLLDLMLPKMSGR